MTRRVASALFTIRQFTVAELTGGYTRYLAAWNGLQPGLGGALSAGIVPDSLTSFYGRRVNLGVGVFVTVRPAERGMWANGYSRARRSS